ncbi:MAG TPA: Hsp20/alpha crystallin family protein [Nitrospiria bacterium]|nr:Hsp20/alpha crystallin family protein [Nitrospiria bacterium]
MFERFFDDRIRFGPRLPGILRERPGFDGPAIDLFETGKDIVLRADLPGVRKDDLEVNLHDHFLVIRGEKKREEEVKKSRYRFAERAYGSFKRSVNLPVEVLSDKVEVILKDGVLEIRLPMAKEAAGRKIEIKVE